MNKITLTGVAITLAACACADIFPADSDKNNLPDVFALRTENSEITFYRHWNNWLMLRVGEKLANPSNAVDVAMLGGEAGTLQRPHALMAHGQSGERFGGLVITHADGTLSTDMVAVKGYVVSDGGDAVATHVALEYKDTAYPFYIKQHYRAMGRSDVFETWLEIRHDEPGPIILSRMDSLSFRLPSPERELYLFSHTGRWAAEAQVTESKIARGQTVSLASHAGTQSAWEGGHEFMLSIGGASSETTGDVLAATLAYSGAAHSVIRRDENDSVSIGIGADLPSGPYVLEPGKKLTLPKVAFTRTNGGKGQASRNIHRWARDFQIPNGHDLRPILLNNWEATGFRIDSRMIAGVMDGAKEMGVELFVLDDGWFGNGKNARTKDTVGLGDWQPNATRFPDGLSGVAKAAAERGLQFGFWVEPEMANTRSDLVETHPDWHLQEPKRHLNCGRGGTQVVLDMTNPEVVANIEAQISDAMASCPGLKYVKWDCNMDFRNYGSKYLTREKQANLWFDYNTGLETLWDSLRKKFPGVMFQACASGGARVDYGALAFAEEFWGSDNTDPNDRVFIQWGESYFYPACALASHVTMSGKERGIPMKFRCDISLSERFGVELVPSWITDEERETVKNAVELYKRTLRPVVQQGDLYRLVSPVANDYAAIMYVSDDKSEAVVFVYGLVRRHSVGYPPALKLQGLDAAAEYEISELDVTGKAKTHSKAAGKTLGGDILCADGIPLVLGRHYDSAVFYLKRK